MTYGEFVQFWFYLAMLVAPIRELGERYNMLQSAFASAERIFDMLDTQLDARSPDAPGARARTQPLRGHVRFEHVSFSYDGRRRGAARRLASRSARRDGRRRRRDGRGQVDAREPALALLRSDARAGSRSTASTCASSTSPTLRRSIGLVLQEDFLFAGTVDENLVMEREDVTDESLELALEASRADELIARLPRRPRRARRRARRDVLDRRAAAARDRARAGRRSAHRDPRRGDRAASTRTPRRRSRPRRASCSRAGARSSSRTASRPCAAPTGSS